MPTPKVLILRAPGTNCDQETAFAFRQAGGKADLVHINRLLDNPHLSADYQILCLPGGFSYGDDVAAGRILANLIRHHLRDTIEDFRAADRLVLGICNGFQVLIKSGVLLPDRADGPQATLTWNDSGRFEDRWVDLQVAGNQCIFLRGGKRLYLPVAHAEGKFVARSPETLESLKNNGQLALRYHSDRPVVNGRVPYPENPNGSWANVAGICDQSGRIFGLMPHPERFIEAVQHPRWTRGERRDQGDGVLIFQNAVGYFTT